MEPQRHYQERDSTSPNPRKIQDRICVVLTSLESSKRLNHFWRVVEPQNGRSMLDPTFRYVLFDSEYFNLGIFHIKSRFMTSWEEEHISGLHFSIWSISCSKLLLISLNMDYGFNISTILMLTYITSDMLYSFSLPNGP